MMRVRSSPDIASLVDAYLTSLQRYLEKRDRLNAENYPLNQLAQRRLVRHTVQDLDFLDSRRDALRPLRKTSS